MTGTLLPRRSRPSLAIVSIGLTLAGLALAAPPVSGADPASNPPRKKAMTGNEAGGDFTAVQLKNLVGTQIGDWKQVSLAVPLQSSAMRQALMLVYQFRNGGQSATLTVTDGGSFNSAPGPAHWTGPPNRRQTDAGAELVYREDGHTVHEIERREPPAREVVLRLANGIIVSAAGDADMAALKALATGLPIAAAERLVRPPS